MRDHPDIENAIRTGYPGGEPKWPHCPVCGSECEDVYEDTNGVVFGCENCVTKKSAWDCAECS